MAMKLRHRLKLRRTMGRFWLARHRLQALTQLDELLVLPHKKLSLYLRLMLCRTELLFCNSEQLVILRRL
jgi:hypothetical protein